MHGTPWRAVAGWLVFMVLCLVVGAAVGTDNIGEMTQTGFVLRRPCSSTPSSPA
ncbi:hypothetical protein [Streptomyces cavernae]|uniref:hypothetical protein n=1 Tax=Streptomyces cavernae TaxID=2259034 RepID=UPI003B75B3BB